MCIGIPMKVVDPGDLTALCEADGKSQRIDMSLVGRLPAGSWVIVHKGVARSHVDADEAGRIASALEAVERVLAGDSNVDDCFPDLGKGRMPLPPSSL